MKSNFRADDHSRVKLLDGNHNDGSDYINANHISVRTYTCCIKKL